MKKIWVLYTGGTIGMVQGDKGLHPNTDLVETALSSYQNRFQFDWHICTPLIDSSAISPHNWVQWIELIRTKLPQYDGILILHGTDTMAYTANILALTLATHRKPIVLTGSQKPFGSAGSDAVKNLDTAIEVFANSEIDGVVIAFAGKCLPAVGSNKISTEVDQGFDNAHFKYGQLGKNLTLSEDRQFDANVKVLPFLLTPGHAIDQIAHNLHRQYADAAVILAYGHGNAPEHNGLLEAISDFTHQGGQVLLISQSWQGCVAAVYEQGNALRQSGIISGGKCNIETAVAVLMVSISNGWDKQALNAELKRLHLI